MKNIDLLRDICANPSAKRGLVIEAAYPILVRVLLDALETSENGASCGCSFGHCTCGFQKNNRIAFTMIDSVIEKWKEQQ